METKAFPPETELEYWKDRAAYLETENAQLRAENSALARRVKELESQVEALMARVLKLTQQVYGRRSELSPKEKVFVGASFQIQNNGRRGQQQGAKGHGRRKHLNLPAREEIHDVFEADRHCPRCGLPYDPFPGDEISEQIDWQVKVERVVHRRKRYHKTCQCPGVPAIITAAPPPKVIPKGLFTARFIARLIIEKYVLGRPLYRIGAAMRMEGIWRRVPW